VISTGAIAGSIARSGERVVLLDDVLATGGSLAAGLKLLAGAGADVIEVATMFEVSPRRGRDALGTAPVFSIVRLREL
jgi:adenine phosphoribosyltransferase